MFWFKLLGLGSLSGLVLASPGLGPVLIAPNLGLVPEPVLIPSDLGLILGSTLVPPDLGLLPDPLLVLPDSGPSVEATELFFISSLSPYFFKLLLFLFWFKLLGLGSLSGLVLASPGLGPVL